ncbi:MAG: FmdB family transcriptional regulator, partial [Collinsella sp.]|nr:FmdB family transcriptional regulator [Collinsella sp.]
MSETPEVVCPSCGAPASKTFSASGIKFDGSGFYNTDQR